MKRLNKDDFWLSFLAQKYQFHGLWLADSGSVSEMSYSCRLEKHSHRKISQLAGQDGNGPGGKEAQGRIMTKFKSKLQKYKTVRKHLPGYFPRDSLTT